MDPKHLIKIGMIATHHFKIAPCEIFLSERADFAEMYRPAGKLGPDSINMEIDTIPLSAFRDGNLRWTMGYSTKFKTLAIHLLQEQMVY